MRCVALIAALTAATSSPAAPLRPTTVYLETMYTTLQADGDCRTKLTVTVYDQYSYPLSGATVTVYKSSGPSAAHFETADGSTTTTAYTNTNGVANLWYCSTESGSSTIYATATKNGLSQNSNAASVEFVTPATPYNTWSTSITLTNVTWNQTYWDSKADPDPEPYSDFWNYVYYNTTGWGFLAGAEAPSGESANTGFGRASVWYTYSLALDPPQTSAIPGDAFYLRISAKAHAATDSGANSPHAYALVSSPLLYLEGTTNPFAETILPAQDITVQTHLRSQVYPLSGSVSASSFPVLLDTLASCQGTDPPTGALADAYVWLDSGASERDGIFVVHKHVEPPMEP